MYIKNQSYLTLIQLSYGQYKTHDKLKILLFIMTHYKRK